jgi:hypothetical protein
MSDNTSHETRAKPLYPLTSSFCYNVSDLLQHELDRLNGLNETDLDAMDMQQRKTLTEMGINKYFQYADFSFGILENGYFLHAISSAAHIDDYKRELGELHARKHLDNAVWEMNAFAVKNNAARFGNDASVEGQLPTYYPLFDTWKQTTPRSLITECLGNEKNEPLVFMINLGLVLEWVLGVGNIDEQYKDVIVALGVLPNGFVVIGSHQAYNHDEFDVDNGRGGAYLDLVKQCLKYRFFVSKTSQHTLGRLHEMAETAFVDSPVTWER